MKTFVTVVGGVLLALSCVTASDARSHAKRQAPTQSEAVYDRSDSNTTRDRDNSCFTSVPALYGCSANGG